MKLLSEGEIPLIFDANDYPWCGDDYVPTFHFATIPGKVFDDSAWRLLCDRVPKYRIYNDELDWGDYHSAPIVDVNTSRR